MNTQKENTRSLIARVITIGLFLFIIFLSKSSDCINTGFYKHPVVIVYVSDIDNKATPGPLVYPQNLNHSIVSCEISTLNTCNNNNFRIISSNHKVGQLLKKCREQFIKIKPLIFDFDSYHLSSLPNDEIPQIS
jgi:hypothetical protein